MVNGGLCAVTAGGDATGCALTWWVTSGQLTRWNGTWRTGHSTTRTYISGSKYPTGRSSFRIAELRAGTPDNNWRNGMTMSGADMAGGRNLLGLHVQAHITSDTPVYAEIEDGEVHVTFGGDGPDFAPYISLVFDDPSILRTLVQLCVAAIETVPDALGGEYVMLSKHSPAVIALQNYSDGSANSSTVPPSE